jgi:hypothetical protein
MVVTAVDELEYLCQTAHATVLIWERQATGKRKPHIFVIERERLEKRARLLEYLKVAGHKGAPQWGRLVEGGRGDFERWNV